MRLKLLALFWPLVALLLALTPASALSGERVALLIGNSQYDRPELVLRNPENDVRALGAVLRKLGFRVTEAVNQDLDGMESAVTEFKATAQGADMALFFYAGHGVQIAGDNHLIGTEFDALNPAELKRASITMADVRAVFEEAKPAIGILVLDACRNNPFSTAGMVEQGLVRTRGGAGLMIAYATDPGNIAFDGIGENSVFTAALLNHIETPGLDARLMLGRVRQQVVIQTHGQQVPWVEEAVLGEHYFAAALPGQAINDPNAQELAYWRTISDSADPEDFNSYLDQYPDGLFGQFARDRIARLNKATQTPPIAGASSSLLLASADLDQVSAALTALGLLSNRRDQTRAVATDLEPALDGYRGQLADPSTGSLNQLFSDASRVSMFLAATTVQRIRTDMVALRSVDRTMIIAQDALVRIAEIAAKDQNALPILQQAKNDIEAIRLSRAKILRRLDQSRSYYDEVLTRATAFVPAKASVALIGGEERARNLAQLDRQLFNDAKLFLKHVAEAEDAKKGSYAWLSDLIPQD